MLVALRRNEILPGRRVALLRVADLEIDALDQRIRQGARELRLSPGEHREIADALGRTDPKVRNNTLARHLSSLRRKLRDDAHRPRYIETVLGVGYRLAASRET